MLGQWVGDGAEGANFWLSVVSDLTDHVLCINRTLVCEGSARDVLTQGRIAEVFGHHHGVYRHEHGEDGHVH